MTDIKECGLSAVIEAGKLIGLPKTIECGVIPYAVVPKGAALESLEDYLERPARARGQITAQSAETFSDYINRFKMDATVIFACQDAFVLTGVIDWHTPGSAAFCEHRVSYSCPRSLEWETWRGAHGKRMSQSDFAQFIEDNVVDVRAPTGADILEVSRNLQAKKKVEFSSALRLSDGSQQFTYAEIIDGTTSKGSIKVPEEFTLGIPVFLNGPLYEVRARLRYRIEGGNLQLWYELYRPEHIERDAFKAVCDDVNTATGITIWLGIP